MTVDGFDWLNLSYDQLMEKHEEREWEIAASRIQRLYFLDITPMVVYSCKKCGKPNFLTPHAFWNINDFGAKCEKCRTINTVTLEKGELRKHV